jgi:hypothetical protein
VLRGLACDARLVHGLGTGLADLADDLADDGMCTVEIADINGDTRARLILARPAQIQAVARPAPERESGAVQRVASNGDRRPGSTAMRAADPVRAETWVAAVASKPDVRREQGSPIPPPKRRPVAPPPAAGAREPAAQAVRVAPPIASASPRDEHLLPHIGANGKVACKQVQHELGWNRSTTRDVLARLVAAGRLRRTEADPRSPTQAYALG